MKLAIGLTAALLVAAPLPGFAQHEHAAPGADQVGGDNVSF